MASKPAQLVTSDTPAVQFQLVEDVRRAPDLVGAVIRYRKVFASDDGLVLGLLGDGRAEIVRRTGDVVSIPVSRIKETIAGPDAEVRSVPGRLLRFLHTNGSTEFRSNEAVATVRRRLDELTQVREHAIGLLLDRGPLSLSLPDCLALPIEPWRVRYEFLASLPTADDATALATSIVSDEGAPAEVRALVALNFGSQSVRQFLVDSAPAAESLPVEWAEPVTRLHEVLYQASGGALRDPVVEELLDLVESNGKKQPSETVLADGSVWPLLLELELTGGAMSGHLGEEFAGVSALTRAKAALFEWEWDDARSIAREGLREARREEVRDELLNIVACALWLQGEPEPALAALDNALEGAYTDALLINASVIAAELEHDSAIDRFVKLAREAPTAHQRAVAAERALVLWDNDDARIWEDDDHESLPDEIRDALRPLIREELPEDRYLRVLRVLADRDSDWLAVRRNDAFGSNLGSSAVRIFRARATGLDKYVEALAAELRQQSPPGWVSQERDGIVEAAIQVLFERNDELTAAFFGLTLIDANLPMAAEQRVPLKCLTVASITANLDPEESEPNLRFIDLVAQAHRELAEVDPPNRDRLSGLVEIAAERLARSYCISRYRQFDDAIDAYNMLMDRIGSIPARNLNRRAAREAFDPIRSFCTDTYDIFRKLRPFIGDAQLQEAIDSMMRQSADIGHRIAAVTR